MMSSPTMDTTSTPTTNKPYRSLFKTIFSTILCIATFSSLLLLHRYSPRLLWLAANAIIFSVYKLSASAHANNSDSHPGPHPIPTSLPSDRWHDYPSPPAEPEYLTEKDVMHVDPVGEEDGEAAIDENMDDTWSAIMMQRSSAAARKPLLKKSDTWERSQPRLRRADEIGTKPELKKSATYKERRDKLTAHNQQVEEKASEGDAGWRKRDVLVVAHDELFSRVENFIKQQHDHLRLQRQESEYRRFIKHLHK